MDEISGNSYTLYKCSPLRFFLTTQRGSRYFKERILQQLSDDLDWVFDPSDEDITSHAGKILLLTFEALEMEDFETDQSYREMPPMQLTLECYVKGKISRQSMVMLPSKIALENNQSVWNYPLILTKLSKGVLNIVLEIFLSDYFATMSPLNITPKTIEHVIFVNLDQYRTPDDDMNMKPQGLLLEYSTGSEELKTIQFEILPDQLVKISALAGGPDKFYQAFCTHILKTTHVKLAALQLKSLSCDILTLSTESSKIKFRVEGPRYRAYEVLYHLLEVAFSEIGNFSWA